MTRSAEFYRKIFGFRMISDFRGRGCAVEAGSRQVLLLFKKGASSASIQSPHDGDGELHLAFAICRRRTAALGSLARGESNRRWKRNTPGRPGASVSISATPTGTCSKS